MGAPIKKKAVRILRLTYLWVRFNHILLPQTVVVEFIIAGVGQMDSESCSDRIEDLHRGIHPDLQSKQETQYHESCEVWIIKSNLQKQVINQPLIKFLSVRTQK